MSVIGPQVNRAVGIAMHEAAHPDVHQDPLGVDRIDYPEGVIQALSPAQAATHRVTATPGDIVAEHGQKGRIDHQVAWNPHPHCNPPVVHGWLVVDGASPYQASLQVGRDRPGGRPAGKGWTVLRWWGVRRGDPNAGPGNVPPAQGGENGDDLATVDVAPGPGLCGGPTLGEQVHLEGQVLTRHGMGDELGGGPHKGPGGVGLQRPHGRPQTRPSEQATRSRALVLREGKDPSPRGRTTT